MPCGIDNELTDRVKRRAAEHYGGFTVANADGGWKAPNGELVTEPVEVLTVLADDSAETPPESFARATAKHLARESDETEVMWFVRQVAAMGFES